MLKKTTLKLSLSVFSSILVSDIMSIILTLSLGLLSGKVGKWILLVISLLNIFTLVLLVYSKPWEEGFRDPTRVKYNRMREFKAKGLVAGLIAEFPFFAVLILYIVAQATGWNSDLWRMIYLFTHMQYNYFQQLEPFVHFPWLNLLFAAPAPVAAGVGYLLGYKRISVGYNILYQKPKNR